MTEFEVPEGLPAFEGVTPEQEERNRKAGIAGHVIINGKRRQAKNIDSLRRMINSTKAEL